ncbi:MAG TPA: hypothetical protein VJT49_09785 [Amycolatopsis sp.]|uniref:hypothetical protein n=1 Tax=Amycolatopsis sp. TaxID=37632 RepID=UPI002B479928|nr:hypothetical protein [Amycolatopsis sp.]HKS45388.1 hypothetical protein [Amycolatopsis sp.]
MPPKTRAPRRGFAITALVLGIVALCGSPIPIPNNVTIIAGVVGVVFGVIALFGVHRVVAGSGTGHLQRQRQQGRGRDRHRPRAGRYPVQEHRGANAAEQGRSPWRR